jgi:hypothetical protein
MMGSMAERRPALDSAEDTALLAGDEDATGVLRVVTAVSLVDIGALDRAAGELLGVINDVAEAVVGVIGQRLGVQHEQATGSPPLLVTMEAFTPNS